MPWKRNSKKMASYQVEVTNEVRREIRRLPGNMRQRVLRILKELEQESQPYNSQPLDPSKSGIELKQDTTLCRIRIASWRIIYFIEEEWKLISVLAIRKRPPYQYDDLNKLLKNIQD
jgi:mRNA interferase RelE/StbE